MRRPVRCAAVLAVTLTLTVGCASAVPSTPDPDVVVTDTGAVRGVLGDGVLTFRGIPYAAPPTGEARWTSPRPVSPWGGVRDATAPTPFCAQDGTELGQPSVTEDCLTLDVTTPATPAPGPRPVLVWVHGGSNKDGGAGMYGAARLAAQGDVVVVAINYRLGALGNLAHPALPGSGAFGLEDQQFALRWVQRNAAAFGGDPDSVTLAGESGGAAAVCAHMSSPGAVGLVDRVILQSADCTALWSVDADSAPREREPAERRGREISAALGCETVPEVARCLRSAPVTALRAASDDGEGMGPAIGTAVLPVDPARALVAGATRPVPVLLGINRDEERFRVYGQELGGGPVGRVQLDRELERLAGPSVDRARAAFPCLDDACAALTLAAASTGARYARGLVTTADRLSTASPTWAYEFADPAAPLFRDLPPPRFPLGSYHTAELPFLFDARWVEPLTAAQQRLSEQMIGYWSRFVHTGDPNGAGAPRWPPYRGPADILGLAPDVIGPVPDFAMRHRVDLWPGLR